MKKDAATQDLLKQDHVQAKVKEKAFLIAESEGFPHGREVIHWLQAEEHVIVEFFGKGAKSVVATAKKLTGKKSAPAETNSAPKPAAKSAPTTNGKAASKPAAKTTAKVASKPAAKAAPKPAAKPAAKKAPAKKGK